MSTSARHNMYIVAESTYGVTPASPQFTLVRHKGTNLGLTKSTKASEELRADRQISDFTHGIREVGGDMSFEMSYSSFDLLLEAALCGTWTANVLKAGTTRRSFSVLRWFSDLTTGQKPYHLFTGVEINNLNISIGTDAIVTGSFAVLGKDLALSDTSPTGSVLGTANTNPVMNSVATILEEGGSVIANVTEINFTLENGLDPKKAVGASTVVSQASIGKCNLSGQLTAFFENSTLLDKFLSGTNSVIKITTPDKDGNKYEILIPKVIYNGGQPDTEGSKEITLALPFQALYDTTVGSCIQITRTPHA